MAIDFRRLELKDALDLAILIEQEARERYEHFSRIVGGRYAGDAADMFREMAGYEAKHESQLAERRRTAFGDTPRVVSRAMFEDVEAPDTGKPRVFMSARQAMEVALASEEKAWEFFDKALQHVKDPYVKVLFQELRGEEAQHAAMVRARIEKLPPGPDLEEEDADEPGSDPGN
jgi:rubrerythrin